MAAINTHVYVIRHEATTQQDAVRAALLAIGRWAPISGETEESAVFVDIGKTTQMSCAGSAKVQMYPDLEFSADGAYLLARKPDAVKTLSPFYVELFDLIVVGKKVPAEAAFVVLYGKEARDSLNKFDLTELCQGAQSGCRVFDIETMAGEGQDGVIGLVMSALCAAANLPDTDMWNFSTYSGDAEDVSMIVFSD